VRLLAEHPQQLVHHLVVALLLAKLAASQRINRALSQHRVAMIVAVSVLRMVQQLHQTSLPKSPRSFRSKSDPITDS
jgi:hypothetical protein